MILRKPKVASRAEEAAVGLLFIGPIVALGLLWFQGDDIYSPNPALNLIFLASTIAVPFSWAYIFLFRPGLQQVLIDDRKTVAVMTYVSAFRGEWWQSLMMLPAPVLGMFFTVGEIYKAILNPGNYAISAADAILNIVLIASSLCFYGVMILDKSIITVLSEGLMCGSRLIAWSDLDRYAEHRGAFTLFLRSRPELVLVYIQPTGVDQRALLRESLLSHGIRQSQKANSVELLVKLAVATMASLFVFVGYWGHLVRHWDGRLVIIMLFGGGIATTYWLEKIRTISNVPLAPPIFLDPEECEGTSESKSNNQQEHPADTDKTSCR